MRKSYDPSVVEPKWRKKWKDAKVFEVDLKKAKKPYYSLTMFPYPSGDKLHVGHWYNYGPADSYSRFKKLQGYDVFHPMGFDAFGLPAENYAIKTAIHPDTSTRNNVEAMIAQLSRIGAMYDWGTMVNTSDPSYYRWTQWLFLQMFSHGLAYKKMGNVNFCPKDQTVLANEQVWDGKCERCGTDVIQKPLNQWYWSIKKYAQALLDGLETLDWPEKTKLMQRNWIGRKEGIDITYKIKGTNETLVCFTTRPDTNFGATFIVIAPEHPFAQKIAKGEISSDHQKEVKKYVDTVAKKTELERQADGTKKTGAFTGYAAINNLNGHEMPIWISDFVLAGFGTGAVVGVPGHDLRDFQFAQTFKIPIIRVVVGPDGDTSEITHEEQVQEETGAMINSEFLDGLPIMEAKEKVKDYLVKKRWGKPIVQYRLRDWLVSRQRYWGAPIPIVYNPEGVPHPVPEEHLPWLLPTDVEFKPTGKSPLTESKEFIARTENIFGKGWRPEFDTMDTFVCSSFYYLRYLANSNGPLAIGKSKVKSQKSSIVASLGSLQGALLIDPDIEKKWMPASLYIGGAEHACMHLIYARFVMMALKDFGFVSNEEPFKKLVHQGTVTNKGAKMSKSKGNVVSPDPFIERHGSDVFRMYLMFMGPFTDGGDWSDTGIRGIDRFVQRVWSLFGEGEKLNKKSVQSKEQLHWLHRTIKRVTENIEAMRFNTALSALMEFLNVLEKQETISEETAKTFSILLAPLAPHLSEELWERFGGRNFVIEQSWPAYDPALVQSDSMTIVVQVNGKVRGDMAVPVDLSKEEILKRAKELENVRKYLSTAPKKEIYVPGKLVSFVVEGSCISRKNH